MKKYINLIILIIVFLLMPSVTYAQQQDPKPEPIPVISNISPVSFSVSWISYDKEEQYITYGKTDPTEKSAVDDRGPGFEGVTHHVTVPALEPNTEYQFKISTSKKAFKQKTAALIPGVLPPLPERFRGNILNEEDSVPEEAMVYLLLPDAQLLSVRASTTGEWQIRTVDTRLKDMTKYYKIRETDYGQLFVRAGYEGENAQKIFVYARENPINLKLSAPRIPFFKIKFPGLEVYEATEAAPTPAPTVASSGAQTASDDGFFRTIWKRVRDIF